MKNLLYLLTLLFNASGFLFSISLVFCINSDNILFLPVIALSCVIFGVSFTLTAMDFVHLNNFPKHKKHCYLSRDNQVIIDYKDYYVTRKSDFIIS